VGLLTRRSLNIWISKEGFTTKFVLNVFFGIYPHYISYLTQRWGDAPVHSIAAALFASRDQIQFFDDIGYEHNPYTHCPKNKDVWERGRCSCDPAKSFGESSVAHGFSNFSWEEGS